MERESYWPSRGKNESRDHGIKCEFFSVAKPIVLEREFYADQYLQ